MTSGIGDLGSDLSGPHLLLWRLGVLRCTRKLSSSDLRTLMQITSANAWKAPGKKTDVQSTQEIRAIFAVVFVKKASCLTLSVSTILYKITLADLKTNCYGNCYQSGDLRMCAANRGSLRTAYVIVIIIRGHLITLGTVEQ